MEVRAYPENVFASIIPFLFCELHLDSFKSIGLPSTALDNDKYFLFFDPDSYRTALFFRLWLTLRGA
jgi:hypothetical protein